MFTGLVTAIGEVRSARGVGGGLRFRIAAPWRRVSRGESIAVDGACLTVTGSGPGWFTVRVIDTSLDRTRFGGYRVGQRVNLERAVRVGDRLGGHLVQGHVDGIGRVRKVRQRKDARVVDLDVPAPVARISVPLGSITVDGVSLTVIARPGPRTVRLSLVPFTLQHTTLNRLEPGAEVHVEGDVIGKYLDHLLAGRTTRRRNGAR